MNFVRFNISMLFWLGGGRKYKPGVHLSKIGHRDIINRKIKKLF